MESNDTKQKFTWPTNKVTENVLLQAMRSLFSQNPDLLPFIFDRTEPQLRRSPGALIEEAVGFSSGERLLVRIALDLWNQSGAVGLWEIIERLDSPAFNNVILTMKILGPKPPQSPLSPQRKPGKKPDPGWNGALF